MQKTVEFKLSDSDAAHLEGALAECQERLARILKQMKKDQAEIEKIGVRTRARLARLKAA